MPGYEGRLELTWTNKPLRLLAHQDGFYEWVPHMRYQLADPAVLRLLDAADELLAQVGDRIVGCPTYGRRQSS